MPTPYHREQRRASLARRYESIAPLYGFHVRRVLHGQSDDERLTIPQFRTLQTLKQLGDTGATNLDLARRISVSPPAMTAMVDGLVDRGFATRNIDPDNRRQVLILLTDAGLQRLDAATSSIEAGLDERLAELSDEEVNHLAAGLDVLEKVFRQLSGKDDA